MDGKKLSEDEDDKDGQFVVEEAGPLPLDMPELEMVSILRLVMNVDSDIYICTINKHKCIIDDCLDLSVLQGSSVELQGEHGEW